MFDLMYEEFYNANTKKVERRKLTPDQVRQYLDPGNPNKRNDLLDLNVVYKRQTTKSLLTVRLYSFLIDKKDSKTGAVYRTSDGHSVKERVVKFQFESGQFDQNRQQGSRMTSQMRFNMDITEFAYFCEIMKTGRVMSLMKRNEAIAANNNEKYAKAAFEIYKEIKGAGAGKRFKVYRGTTKDICIETSQEPLQNGQSNGQTIPSVKIMHGLDLSEAGQLGAMGGLALETLNMWYAFGKAEENLELINARPRKKAAGTADMYQNAQPRAPQQGQNGYAAQGNPGGNNQGYAAQGYGQPQGYGYDQNGYSQGYAAQGYGQPQGYGYM